MVPVRVAASTLPPRRVGPAADAPAGEGLTWAKAWDWFIGAPMTIVIILLTAFVLRWIVHRAIGTFVRTAVARREAAREQADGNPVVIVDLPIVRRQAHRAARVLTRSGLLDTARHDQRITTVGSVLRSVASVLIWSIAALLVLDQLGVNLSPLLASAGVGGIAVAFGAQTLVKDFLSGLFMMFEDQYGVGDVVDLGEAKGTVEEVTLRVTKLRDPDGVAWYVRNGDIIRVANKSQGWSTALVDVPVSADEDLERVLMVLREALADMDSQEKWSDLLLEQPRVLGVESVTGGAATVRVLAKCAPNEHFTVQREIRERSLVALNAAGIRGPVVLPGMTHPAGSTPMTPGVPPPA